MNTTAVKALFFVFLVIFNLKVWADSVITECTVEKVTYVHFASKNSLIQNDRTNLRFDASSTGESYILVRHSPDKYEPLLLDLNYYNILYKSKNHPEFDWNAVDQLKKQGGKASTLSNNTPIIIKLDYPRIQEQLYYFNIDSNGNGHMSMTSTRWYSFLDATNNQSLFYATCKKPKL